jgi:hypothetical protein
MKIYKRTEPVPPIVSSRSAEDFIGAEKQLRIAQQRAEEAQAAWAADIFSPRLRAQYSEADDRLLVAERAAAASRGEPYAEVWEGAFPWSRMVMDAITLGNMFDSILVYKSTEGVVKLVFRLIRGVRFSDISDETIMGHELYGRGLASYGRFKVIKSPWIDELRRVDSVHTQHDPSTWDSAQHFMLLLKDCIYEVVVRDEPRVEILSSSLDELKESLGVLIDTSR